MPISYEVELSGEVFTYTAEMTSTTFILDPGTYTWRVRALTVDDMSAYTEPWEFTVLNRIFLPVILRQD